MFGFKVLRASFCLICFPLCFLVEQTDNYVLLLFFVQSNTSMNSVDFSLIETLALFPSFQETDHLGVFLLWEALIVNIARFSFLGINACALQLNGTRGYFVLGILASWIL